MFATVIAAAADPVAQSRIGATTDGLAAPDWTVAMGLESRIIPAWPGASDTRFAPTALPLFGIRRADTPPSFSRPRDSFGLSLLELGQFKLEPALRLISDGNGQNYKELYGFFNMRQWW